MPCVEDSYNECEYNVYIYIYIYNVDLYIYNKFLELSL